MKHLLLISAFIFVSVCAKAQINLVPNPSFELYDTCPQSISGLYDEVRRAIGWTSWHQTPDYYNVCANGLSCGVPSNQQGFQYPHSGNAYCGIITWSIPYWREIIGAMLSSPLIIGQKYYLSYFINYAGYDANMSTNKMGVKFTTLPYSRTNPVPIDNSPQFYSALTITDTVNWIKLSGSFVADSAYQYLALGNFFDDSHIDTTSVPGTIYVAYYFVDDFCISTDSVYVNTWTGIPSSILENAINILPNPTSEIINIKYNELEPPDVEVNNSLGQEVRPRILFSSNNIELNFEDLYKGFYFLHIKFKQKTITKKIIITK